MNIKNEHLIPQMVLDIGTKIDKAGESERFALLARLQAIHEFCSNTIERTEKKGSARV